MKLPFLKDKRPRVARDKPEEKLINASADDHMDDHAMGELFEACEKRDTKQFLDAVAALVMNMFDYGDDNGK